MDVAFSIPVVSPSTRRRLNSPGSSEAFPSIDSPETPPHKQQPLGMLGRFRARCTDVPASPTGTAAVAPAEGGESTGTGLKKRPSLAVRMQRAASARRSVLERAVSSARSHLAHVQTTAQRKADLEREARERTAAKLRAKLEACESRRRSALARRLTFGGSGSTTSFTPRQRTASAASTDSTASTRSSSGDAASSDEGATTTSVSLPRNLSSDSLSSQRSATSSSDLETAIADFVALDLVRHDASSRTLDDLVAHVEDETTLRVTRVLLNEIAAFASASSSSKATPTLERQPMSHARTASRTSIQSDRSAEASDEGVDVEDPVPETDASNPFDTRMFLAALATSLSPSQVLRPGNPLDDNLFEKTTLMMDSFARLLGSPTKRRVHHFAAAWSQYARQFAEWKLASQQTLIQELIAHFVEVDRMWATAHPRFLSAAVGSTESATAEVATAAAEYLEGLRTRQQLIFNRLRRFGGAEAEVALARFRRDLEFDHFDLMRDPADELLGPSLSSTGHASGRRSDSVAAGFTTPLSSPLPSPAGSPPVSPTTTAPSNQPPASDLNDVRLAHELFLEGTLSPPADPHVARVQATLKRAFRDQTTALAAQGQLRPWFPDCLGVLCDNICMATPDPESTRPRVAAVCDTAWLRERLERGALDVAEQLGVLDGLRRLMRELCAPVRDAALADLAPPLSPPTTTTSHPNNDSAASVATLLFALLDISEAMRQDLARVRMHSVKPVLRRTIVPLERAHFRAFLDAADGSPTAELPRTRAWLAHAVESSGIATTTTPSARSGTLYRTLWDAAFVGLVVFPRRAAPAGLPETFPFDGDRLDRLSERAHRALLFAALITHARSRSGSSDSASGVGTAVRPAPVVALVRAGRVPDAVAQLTAVLDSATAVDALVADLARLCGAEMHRTIARCLAKTDPVYKLLVRRIEAALRTGLAPTTSTSSDSPPAVAAVKGLEAVQDQVASLVQDAVRLAAHNRHVYSEWYDIILDDVMDEARQRAAAAEKQDGMAAAEATPAA
ncbi:hypothetical protein H9P43_005335 [Blastocladiella emersonii ATCC 22665]|nr:hypothetical protein H9P43_005327 [Blastocladiella emersonii ATCC 22665]KAI9178673.1 hypothetical protein H9P43_005335 [Blastocladiella emersonii ATCC 22665]